MNTVSYEYTDEAEYGVLTINGAHTEHSRVAWFSDKDGAVQFAKDCLRHGNALILKPTALVTIPLSIKDLG